MRIRMKNFRCYEDQTFDFGENGLALLSGPSGQGKSTVMMGIHFALYGTGTKVTSYGKTSCIVELEFDGLKIVRTKRPNRLVVNDMFEDASAQEIINNKFGDTFDVTGYIQQNSLNSFILMSPIEKLAFLEKFAFRDVDLTKIKARCKANITKRNEELICATSQLDMAKKVLAEQPVPIEVKFPLKCTKANRDKAVQNERTRLKNCTTLIRRATNLKAKIQAELSDLRVLQTDSRNRTEHIANLSNQIDELDNELSTLTTAYHGDTSIKKYEERLTRYVATKELRTLEQRLISDTEKLQSMYETEKNDIQAKLDAVQSQLWRTMTKTELHDTMSDLKSCLSDLEKVESLRKGSSKYTVDTVKHEKNKQDLKRLLAEVESKQFLYDQLMAQQELYHCPSCRASLRLVDNNLVISEKVIETDQTDIDTVQTELKTMKNLISRLQRTIPVDESNIGHQREVEAEITTILSGYEEIPVIDTIREELDELRQYQSTQADLEKKSEKLRLSLSNNKFSSSYEAYKQEVEKLRKNVETLRKSNNTGTIEDLDEEKLRKMIYDQKQIHDRVADISGRRSRLINDCTKSEKSLREITDAYIAKHGEVRNLDFLTTEITRYDKSVSDQEKEQAIHQANLDQIDVWSRYQTDQSNYQKNVDRVKTLTETERVARDLYAAATQLKDKIMEAESIAMENVIDSINTHSRVYLDCFFADNPIAVQLLPFKENKKGTAAKPQICIQIEYKGMEADLNTLSGGELSRVILAYTLALAEMFNTPLLLLDECTASLDQDLTNIVFGAIRENFNGKMTLIIAHQVVTGTFDKVIRLGDKDVDEK
jgi:DNA repair exonuclease SbcCD ATPase subunit